MQELIDKLVKLQDVLKQIYEYEKTNKILPRNIKKLRDEFEPQKKILAEEKDALEKLKDEQSFDEQELQKTQDQLNGIEERRQSVKTQKEYEAVADEQTGLEQQIAGLKSNIQERSEKIEKIEKELEEKSASFDEQEAKIAEEEAKVEQRIKENSDKIAGLVSQKAEMGKGIDNKILKRFERVLKRKNGVAIVPVIEESCQGCHMNLPPQLITEVKRKDKLVSCLNCSRYLYMDE